MASTAEICEHLLTKPPQAQSTIAYNYLVPNIRGLESLVKILDGTGVPADATGETSKAATTTEAVSYTHLTLPTICSV